MAYFLHIYHKNQQNAGKYTIHGSYECGIFFLHNSALIKPTTWGESIQGTEIQVMKGRLEPMLHESPVSWVINIFICTQKMKNGLQLVKWKRNMSQTCCSGYLDDVYHGFMKSPMMGLANQPALDCFFGVCWSFFVNKERQQNRLRNMRNGDCGL